jgi:hypothetical protein
MNTQIGLAVALSLGSGIEAQDAPGRFVDLPVERRIVVTVAAPDSTSAHPMVIRLGGRITHSVTVHRFLVEALGQVGQVAWDVTLLTGASNYRGMSQVVSMTADIPEIQVPRPYGLQLDANDSLLVVASVRGGGTAVPAMRITIEYEPSEGLVSRIPVVSLSASEMNSVGVGELDSAGERTVRSWTWVPAVGGRMVAISGRPLAGAEELVLEDATTGEVLWSMRAQSAHPGVADQPRELIRPSVSLLAGRTYRLAARFAKAIATVGSTGYGMPLAMMVPTRSR